MFQYQYIYKLSLFIIIPWLMQFFKFQGFNLPIDLRNDVKTDTVQK